MNLHFILICKWTNAKSLRLTKELFRFVCGCFFRSRWKHNKKHQGYLISFGVNLRLMLSQNECIFIILTEFLLAGERTRKNILQYLLLFYDKVNIDLNVKFVANELTFSQCSVLTHRMFKLLLKWSYRKSFGYSIDFVQFFHRPALTYLV